MSENQVPHKNNPKISIVMPSYNMAHFLPETVDTIIQQTFPDWELIIQDGGSSDDTLDLLEEYSKKDPRISFVSEPDEGPYDAIHRAMKRARGEYLGVVCISDGYLDKNWLSYVYEAFERDSEISLVWGIPMDMSAEGDLLGPNFQFAHFLEDGKSDHRRRVLRNIMQRIDLMHPVRTIRRTIRKTNRTNFAAVRSLMKKTQVPQKQDWFQYWLETGVTYPDNNMILSRRVFMQCLPPYERGTRDSGDWSKFYYDFNAGGYLAWCIPILASIGRAGGAVSDAMLAYNENKRKIYLEKLEVLRAELAGDMIEFQDRNSNPI